MQVVSWGPQPLARQSPTFALEGVWSGPAERPDGPAAGCPLPRVQHRQKENNLINI